MDIVLPATPPALRRGVLLDRCTVALLLYTHHMTLTGSPAYNEPTEQDNLFSTANALRQGDLFVSDRASEGLVEVLYDYGKCPHDNRPDSVYVREYGTTGDGIFSASWFIAIPEDWVVYLTRRENAHA